MRWCNFIGLFCLTQTITVCNSKMLNTRQSSTKNSTPKEHVMTKLKKSGINAPSKLPTKLQSAITGMEIRVNLKKYLLILSDGHTCFLIILIFKIAEVEKHPPIAQISAFMPTYFGKNHMHSSIMMAPRI